MYNDSETNEGKNQMEKWIALLGDICVIIFDLLLYIHMTVFRHDTRRNRGILYGGYGVIVVFYVLAVYVFSWPVSVSAFACMTIPSLALFWIFCKYRDARFFLTFCFVDTVSLVIGFIARYIGMLLGNGGSVLAIVLMVLAFLFIYIKGKPYFVRYREALEFIQTGWKRLTIAAALIYVTMIFTAVYPQPLIERPEYCLSYLAVSVMVLSFYAVFLTNIAATRKVYEQSLQLRKQQKWFRMAYVDALTEVPNRMAYIEKIHELEHMDDPTIPVAVIVLDLDHFKRINDTRGHAVGDDVLKQAADCLSRTFSDARSTVYRIGGDEFAVVAVGAEEDAILRKLADLGRIQDGRMPYSISFGYSFVDRSENNAVEQAFSRADAMMYANKTRKMNDET